MPSSDISKLQTFYLDEHVIPRSSGHDFFITEPRDLTWMY